VPVHVFTVGDNEDAHDLVLVIDTVDNPVFTTGDTVMSQMTRAHLPATVRARVSLEFFDSLANLLIIGRGTLTNLLQHLLEIVFRVKNSDLKHCFSYL
jgi:hypothetical protein